MADEFTTGNLYLGSGTNVSDTEFDIRLSTEEGISTLFNASGNDIDFRVNASGRVGIHVDADTGRVGIGTGQNIGAALHVVSQCPNDGLRVETRTDCPTGVQIEFIHRPMTAPENNSIPVQINLAGRNDNSEDVNYARIISKALNTSNGSEVGELIFTVASGDTDFPALVLNPFTSSIGTDNLNSGNNYLFIGNNNYVSGDNFVVIGNNNTGVITSGILIGIDNSVSGERVLIVADNTVVSGDQDIVFALDSEIYGDSNLVMTENVLSTGDQNIVLGHSYNTTGDFNILLLNDSDQVGSSGVGFGNQVSNSGQRNVYVGNFNTLQGDDCVVIGSDVEVTGNNNILYGSTSSLSGTSIISIGAGNDVLDINSGVFIGSNIDLVDGEKSVIVGLGNTTSNGLTDSIIIGIENTTTNGSPTGVIVIGQDNRVSVVKNTTIIGNSNEASGTVLNNVVYGTLNSTPLDSRNNVIVGVMNNTSGNILSDGTVDPSGRLPDSTMVNSVTYGVNNIVSEISGTNIVGSKTYASGQNINAHGSLNQIKQSNDSQVIGHSNFMVGDNNTIVGSYNDIVGNNSVLVSTSSQRQYAFGDGNISVGNSEAVISGMTVGFGNDLDAVNGVIYGSGNQIGLRRHMFTLDNDGADVILAVRGDQRGIYLPGSQIMLAVLNPANKDAPILLRSMNGVNYTPNDDTTNITINSTIITPTDAPNYAVNAFFDDPTYNTGDRSVISGWIMPYQSGNSTDLINNPLFGFGSIVLGTNNTSMHAQGIVIGQGNAISGTNHMAIGQNLEGFYNNAVQIGSTNLNKLYFDNSEIVFNTGGQQDRAIFNTSISTVEDDPVSMIVEYNQNRVGINNNDPSSELDVSGIITSNGIKLYGENSNISGWVPVNTGDGTVTWQEPTTLSGINSGILMKHSDTVATGLYNFSFNTSTQSLEYNRSDTIRNNEFLFIPSQDQLSNAVRFSTTGVFFNEDGTNNIRDYGYRFCVYGSGTTDSSNNRDGTINVYLLNTIKERNEVQMTNFTGVSGAMRNLWADTSINAPGSLTGTFLYVDNTDDNALLSKTVPPFSTLFAMQTHWQSGDRGFRYYPEDYGYVVTIGSSGFDQTLESTYSDASKSPNVVLSNSTAYGSTFNAAGVSKHPFRVVQSGQQTTNVGMQYSCASGILGIGVGDNTQTTLEGTTTNQQVKWDSATYDNARLLVNGKIRTCGLQMTTSDGNMVGNLAVGRYLKVIDKEGNIAIADVTVSQDFLADWPLSSDTLTDGSRTTYKIATTGTPNSIWGGTTLPIEAAGIGLHWNGAIWVQGYSHRFGQPPASNLLDTYVASGVALGPEATYLNVRHQHTVAGQPIAPLTTVQSQENWRGSAQETLVQLKARTISNVTSELTSDFNKTNGGPAATVNNTIALILNEEVSSENRKNLVWRIEVSWTALVEDNGGGFDGASGKYNFGVLSTHNGVSRSTDIFDDADAYSVGETSTNLWSSTNPITASINTTGGTTLKLDCQGVAGKNILWSAHVRCIQQHLPENVSVAGNGV
jgi:hypothetical protein